MLVILYLPVVHFATLPRLRKTFAMNQERIYPSIINMKDEEFTPGR
jgi:hypothetical protein